MYYTLETLSNHVFEDLRKPKAPNSSHGSKTEDFPGRPAHIGDGQNGEASSSSFFSDVLFIQGRVEDSPIFDDEPIILGRSPAA
jgi:hypothetical protein